jgi:hypothetical protein
MVFPQGKLGGLNSTSDSRVFHAENFGSVVDGNDSGLAHFLRAVLEVSMATMITKCGHLKEMLVVTVKEATTFKCLSSFYNGQECCYDHYQQYCFVVKGELTKGLRLKSKILVFGQGIKSQDRDNIMIHLNNIMINIGQFF